MASPKINRREKHSLMMIGGKQIGGQRPRGRNQDGHGMTKSEDFFLSVCATGGVHTLRVARTFFLTQFLCVTYKPSRTRMAQGVCSAHVISLHLTLSIFMFHPPSLLFPGGHFETTHLPDFDVVDFLAELFPTRKRRSSTLPYERRGVWLLGRSHALHRLRAQSVRQGHFCGR